MPPTTPNKEAIRRICYLNNATYCYLLISESYEEVLTVVDINPERVKDVENELLEWCGMTFKIFPPSVSSDLSRKIRSEGEKIFPIFESK